MTVPSPSELATSILGGRRTKAARLLASAINLLTWVTLPGAFLSAVSDLRITLDWIGWLYRHAGLLQPLLTSIGSAVAWWVEGWRELVDPIRSFLFGLFPFELPVEAFDILILIMLPTSRLLIERFAHLRVRGNFEARWKGPKARQLLEAMKSAGFYFPEVGPPSEAAIAAYLDKHPEGAEAHRQFELELAEGFPGLGRAIDAALHARVVVKIALGLSAVGLLMLAIDALYRSANH